MVRSAVWPVSAWARLFRSRSSLSAIAKLAGGNAFGQLVLLAVAPILTRLYSPEDLGDFALFVAVATILVAVSCLRYDLAIMLPDGEAEALAIVKLSLALVSVAAVSSGVACLAIGLVGVPWTLGHSLPLLPLAVAGGGFALVANAYAVRVGCFGLVATRTTYRSVVVAVLQVSQGLIRPTSLALTSSYTAGQLLGNIATGRMLVRGLRAHQIGWRTLRETARRYVSFPLQTLPATLLSSYALSVLPIFIGPVFGTTTLGQWSVAQRVLVVPITMLGAAVGQVYYKRAVLLRDSKSQSLRLFRKTAVSLALFSLPLFVVFGVFAQPLFGAVFGQDWRDAGLYAQIMLPWIWTRFITSPLSLVNAAFERNHLGLAGQVVLASVTSLSMLLAVVREWSFTEFLVVTSWSLAIAYSLVFVGLRRVVAREYSVT